MSDQPNYPTAEVGGFRIGMFVSYDDCGDAWVGRRTAVMELLSGRQESPSCSTRGSHPTRMGAGTYSVRLPLPMTTDVEAALFLEALLPKLRERWEQWKASR